MDQLGKPEKFLEDALVASPELMGLETRRSGIRGPFRVFQQLSLDTPSGRTIFPDIVLLAGSGHVIVVEVKRYVNPELRDRAVIAQIIDYASSFAALAEDQLVQIFSPSSDESLTWPDLVRAWFPDDTNSDELAATLLSRLESGEINLVIACDKVPAGLPAIVAGIASQQTLGFDLDLVEVTPFVLEVAEHAEVLLVPSTRLQTEIVSRTAVTVTYCQGDAQPATSVQTTSMDEIAENVRATQRKTAEAAKQWTPQEVEAEFRQAGNAAILDLLQFAKEHSADGQYVASGRKVSPTFCFYLTGRSEDGLQCKRMVFNSILNWSCVNLYLGAVSDITKPEVHEEYLRRLNLLFGNAVNTSGKESGMPIDVFSAKLEEFKQLMLWLKENTSAA